MVDAKPATEKNDGMSKLEPPDTVFVTESPAPWPLPPRINDDGTRAGPLFPNTEKLREAIPEKSMPISENREGRFFPETKRGGNSSSPSPEKSLEGRDKNHPQVENEERVAVEEVNFSSSNGQFAEKNISKDKEFLASTVSPKPHVIQKGDNQVSYAIFERVAQLYPASMNKRALSEAEAKKTGEEVAKLSDKAGKARGEKEPKNQRKFEATQKMGSRNSSRASSVDRSSEIGRKPLHTSPPVAPAFPDAPRGSAVQTRIKKGVALFQRDEDDYEFEMARKERNESEHSEAELPSFDSGQMLSTPGRYKSPSRTNSNGSVGSGATSLDFGPVCKIDSPTTTTEGPSVVIRKPMGSRRPSFVCISDPRVQSVSNDNADSGTILPEKSLSSDEVGQFVGDPEADGQLSSSSCGKGHRGEEGNLSGRESVRTHQEAMNKPPPYEGSASIEDSGGDSVSSPSATCSENSADALKKKRDPGAKNGNNTSPLSSPLHDTPEGSQGSKWKRRLPGPDTPEAARTEFSVAYSLERAMEIVSKICRVDLNKAVYRRQTGSKLRVENKPGSIDAHMVVSVELRKVMDGLTHVQVRASKSDHGKTAFATLWTFYDDLVTQLEVIAHNAAQSAHQEKGPTILEPTGG